MKHPQHIHKTSLTHHEDITETSPEQQNITNTLLIHWFFAYFICIHDRVRFVCGLYLEFYVYFRSELVFACGFEPWFLCVVNFYYRFGHGFYVQLRLIFTSALWVFTSELRIVIWFHLVSYMYLRPSQFVCVCDVCLLFLKFISIRVLFSWVYLHF